MVRVKVLKKADGDLLPQVRTTPQPNVADIGRYLLHLVSYLSPHLVSLILLTSRAA